LKRGEYDTAATLLHQARETAQRLAAAHPDSSWGAIVDSLEIDIAQGAGKTAEAVKLADAARERYPLSRGIAHQYADALLADGRRDDAIAYLRDQAQLYREEPQLQGLLAKAYAEEGKKALQHLALAEEYALDGSLLAALDQLGMARKGGDASYYENSVIDAREREFKERWNDEQVMLNKKKEKDKDPDKDGNGLRVFAGSEHPSAQ
jgi:predicted Zn-dependent protease